MPSCPTYCQAERKIRSCSRRRTSGSEYQLQGSVSAIAKNASVAPMRLPALLRELDFRRFWIGQTVSLFGDQITLIALPLTAVLILDAGPAEMGYLVAAELAPALLFSLHAGAWIDRRGRRRQAMIATDLGRAALIATIPLAYAAGAR